MIRLEEPWRGVVSIVVLILIVTILVIAWVEFLPDASGAESTGQCSEASAAPEPSVASKDLAPVPLILEQPEGVKIDFGRDRGVHWRTIYLQAAKKNVPAGQTGFAPLVPETVLGVSERPLEREELEGHIGPTQYVASASVTARKEVSLTLCVDASALELDPGTYVGSVRLSGGGIQPITVPVSVTAQYDAYRWIVALLGVVTFLAGSFVVWASHMKAKQGSKQVSIWSDVGELPGWIADNYVGVVGGVIAMTSVFIARYWRSPAWGARAPEDWFALLGAMFTAYTATLTAATAIVTPRQRGITDPGDAVAAPDAGQEGGA